MAALYRLTVSFAFIPPPKQPRTCRDSPCLLSCQTMPRIATTPTIEVRTARAQLRHHITALGISDNEYSRRSGVPQYTLSKFLNGHIKTITPAIERALNYANIGIAHDITPLTQNPAIRRALGHAWDGTEQGAETLALMIEAMAPVLRSTQSSVKQ